MENAINKKEIITKYQLLQGAWTKEKYKSNKNT